MRLFCLFLFANIQGKVFVYDKVFKPNATQESVYNMVAKPIVKGMLTCIFEIFKFPQYVIVSHMILNTKIKINQSNLLVIFLSFVSTFWDTCHILACIQTFYSSLHLYARRL